MILVGGRHGWSIPLLSSIAGSGIRCRRRSCRSCEALLWRIALHCASLGKNSACFEYDERMIGYIKDYRRVFYQGSTDHRGIAEYPGRVVTLEAKEGVVTWGVAYRVSGDDNEKLVLSADCLETPTLCNVLVYVGSSDISRNKFWAGPAPLEAMAKQIAQAVGPSGPNYEYLFLLEKSLCELAPLVSSYLTIQTQHILGANCVDQDICELAEAV